LEGKVRDFETSLTREQPPVMEELKQDLEDVQEQLKMMEQGQKGYLMQIDRVLALAGTLHGDRVDRDTEIVRFSGADKRAVSGWMVPLAMKIEDEPR
jgi:hypothetical protein